VQPHYRSSPDGSRLNNWSTRGNVNPYTGKPGTVDPYRRPRSYDVPSSGAPSSFDGARSDGVPFSFDGPRSDDVPSPRPGFHIGEGPFSLDRPADVQR
jgi:hypothetical protein